MECLKDSGDDMGKIKGWKKVWKGNRIRYDDNYGNSILIQKNDYRKRYDVVIFYNKTNDILKSFETKDKAMKYAINYMRRHPR